MASAARRWRFWLTEHVVLPLAIVPLRLLVRSWRLIQPADDVTRAAVAAPRLIMVGFHGKMAPSLAFSPIASKGGRRLFAMLSPSRDGRLLAALLAHLGIGHVYATDQSRSVAGSRELIARVTAGDIGYIALDGPRGPRGAVKPGAVRLAATAGAHILAATPSVTRAIRFGSWDRPVLPLPFATVTMTFLLLDPPREEEVEATCAVLESFLTEGANDRPRVTMPTRE